MKVIKRDGSIEDFQPAKIARVTKAAGLEASEAEALSKRVEAWAANQGQEKISSLAIRDKVIEELKATDEYAANMFTWYQKTKDNHQNG